MPQQPIRPGIRQRELVQNKRYRVRTKFGALEWLHAIDPLEPGQADKVRSEWRVAESEATIFTSRTYAEDVAKNAPYGRPFSVEPMK